MARFSEFVITACDDGIQVSIAIKIAKREGIASLPRGKGRRRSWRETATPVSEQDGEGVLLSIRGDDVRLPILVDVNKLKAVRFEFGRRTDHGRRTGCKCELAA